MNLEQIMLNALRAAGEVVQQHNLLSTATEEERKDTISRHIDWWNHTALPVIAMAENQRKEGCDETP
jgi:hypothetical protein